MIKAPITDQLDQITIQKLNALRNLPTEEINFKHIGKLIRKHFDKVNKIRNNQARAKTFGSDYAQDIKNIRQMAKWELNKYLKDHKHVKGYSSDYCVNKKGKYTYKKDDYKKVNLYVYAFNRLVFSK
tara:strand:+ start:47 stop:427 length:381 start_codon:yes stop_codon:yes gene_type:complete